MNANQLANSEDTKVAGEYPGIDVRPQITPDLSAVSAQAGRTLGETEKDPIIYRSAVLHPRPRSNFGSAEPRSAEPSSRAQAERLTTKPR